MVVPNTVMKFHNVDIFTEFDNFLTCRLLTPACVVSVKKKQLKR